MSMKIKFEFVLSEDGCVEIVLRLETEKNHHAPLNFDDISKPTRFDILCCIFI